jgi:hypothetical protein
MTVKEAEIKYKCKIDAPPDMPISEFLTKRGYPSLGEMAHRQAGKEGAIKALKQFKQALDWLAEED